LPYHALALRDPVALIDDIPACDLKMLADRTYTNVYRHCGRGATPVITPLTTLEPGFHLLELSNGPTLAFKDMAMQLLGNLFEYVLEKRGETINILGATSGDTGSAAEYAMRGKQGVKVFMLSPDGKMSPSSGADVRLQDANIFNIAVDGMFDDCQDIVKAVSNDPNSRRKLQDRRGQLDQLGARAGAGGVLLQGLLSRPPQPTTSRSRFAVPSGNFRQHLRRPHRAHDGPADRPPGAGHQRKRRARRVLPHRRLPPCAHGRNQHHLQPVDGHFQGQPTSSASFSTWSAAKELEGIEGLPQRVEVVDAAVDQVKAIIARHC
jgi:hypothetical protein